MTVPEAITRLLEGRRLCFLHEVIEFAHNVHYEFNVDFFLHYTPCIMQACASCRHVHHAGTCIMQARASCRHVHHAGTCIMQARASCRHVHHAGTCIMQACASCRHVHHAGMCMHGTHSYEFLPCTCLHDAHVCIMHGTHSYEFLPCTCLHVSELPPRQGGCEQQVRIKCSFPDMCSSW